MTAVLPAPVITAVEPYTGRIRALRPLSGGCIAHAGRLEAERGVFFLKWAEGPAGAGQGPGRQATWSR